MLPKKLMASKLEEQAAKEYLQKKFSRYAVSDIRIDKTPLGIKVVLKTQRPGALVTRASGILKEAATHLGKQFKQEPPHIEVEAVQDPLLDPEVVADAIAFKISKYGPMRYKAVAHDMIDQVMAAGAKGVEIEIGGVIKERAAHFKFRPPGGVLPKSGQVEQYGVRKTKKQLLLKRGMIGIKVTVVSNEPMPGEVQFKDGGKLEGSGNGAPENEHKENAGAAAS